MVAQQNPHARVERALAFVLGHPELSDMDARTARDLRQDLQRKACVSIIGPHATNTDALVEILLGTRVPVLPRMPKDLLLHYAQEPSVQLTHSDGTKVTRTLDSFDGGAQINKRCVFAEIGLPIAALRKLIVLRTYLPAKPADFPKAAQWISKHTDIGVFAAPEWTPVAEEFWTELPELLMDHAAFVQLDKERGTLAPKPHHFKTTLMLDLDAAAEARFAPEVDLAAFKATGAAALVGHIRHSIETARQHAADKSLVLLNKLEQDGIYEETAFEAFLRSGTSQPAQDHSEDEQSEAERYAMMPAREPEPPMNTHAPEAMPHGLDEAIAVLTDAGVEMQKAMATGTASEMLARASQAIGEIIALPGIEGRPALLDMALVADDFLDGLKEMPGPFAVSDCITVLLQLKRRIQAEMAASQDGVIDDKNDGQQTNLAGNIQAAE